MHYRRTLILGTFVVVIVLVLRNLVAQMVAYRVNDLSLANAKHSHDWLVETCHNEAQVVVRECHGSCRALGGRLLVELDADGRYGGVVEPYGRKETEARGVRDRDEAAIGRYGEASNVSSLAGGSKKVSNRQRRQHTVMVPSTTNTLSSTNQ